jgi:hypothetical protein
MIVMMFIRDLLCKFYDIGSHTGIVDIHAVPLQKIFRWYMLEL